MPQSRYVLSEVKKRDIGGYNSAELGHQSENEYTVRYEYTGGYYSRTEKEFYGFGTVTAETRDNNNREVST